MTTDDVINEIELAMQTLRHMPSDGPRDPNSAWPDVWRSPHDAYGWLPAEVNRMPPTSDAITRMGKVLDEWLPRLTAGERILVTARGTVTASGEPMGWRKIARIRGGLPVRSHEHHRRAWPVVIAKIANWPSVRAA